MTFPEVEQLLKTYQNVRWEDRLWDFAMQTKKPFETYSEMVDELEASDEHPQPKIDELPKVQQDWLRAT